MQSVQTNLFAYQRAERSAVKERGAMPGSESPPSSMSRQDSGGGQEDGKRPYAPLDHILSLRGAASQPARTGLKRVQRLHVSVLAQDGRMSLCFWQSVAL